MFLIRYVAPLALCLALFLPRHADALTAPVPTTPLVCAGLTLRLQPGSVNLDGTLKDPAPADMPLDPVLMEAPLHPGAAPSRDRVALPPPIPPLYTHYLKTAATEYSLPIATKSAIAWYRTAFTTCGYRIFSSGRSSDRERSSSHITFQSPTTPNLWVSLTLQGGPSGNTLLVYYAYAVTLPPRPPGSFVMEGSSLKVTYILPGGRSAWNVALTDRMAINDLILAVNSLSRDVFVHTCFSGRRDSATLHFIPQHGKAVTLTVAPACYDAGVAGSIVLSDTQHAVWNGTSAVVYRYCLKHRCRQHSVSPHLG